MSDTIFVILGLYYFVTTIYTMAYFSEDVNRINRECRIIKPESKIPVAILALFSGWFVWIIAYAEMQFKILRGIQEMKNRE